MKFLLIIFLIAYAFYKIGGYLFRVFFINAAQQQRAHQNRSEPFQRRKARGGNVNIDYVPNPSKDRKEGMKGGEYVDYEDVDESE